MVGWEEPLQALCPPTHTLALTRMLRSCRNALWDGIRAGVGL